ncbi:double-stranded RNA-binding protein Staufen homolog 2 [Contarinia nasturtii]|uniref:double-stranded RNA-binding protein Staufen homolog 2 n=1 Tax=Contarinia nasturtii TaxID=265458 RepID=UPI0012D3C6F4|nr:double-stranded RNA-binding protein Staufen homolog 2 [Contarinia nasturtii]XP_031638508.1 double-stranded RNA-binding protein Staufen homolog 2 [Contarinia nasturtii]
MMRPPHMPPQTATHHMSNMSQHQQSHMNMATGQQPHNHMMHNHQNYHQNRSGNHHSHQRSYGQNRPNFHNGNHNMHSNHGPNNVANISTTVSQPQQQQQQTNINNKLDTNINVQPQQSNSQSRYKTMESTNLSSNQQPHATQKSSIQMTSNGENALNMDIMELNHGCVDDQGAVNVIATSNTSSKTKSPMCLINELVRTNQLKHQYRITDERGPSHDKLYTVVLELGDERYTAQSKTVKGAQQSAATAALEKTNYKQASRPRGFLIRYQQKYGPGNTVTPTVQLNALAMKRGIPTNYSYTYPKSYNEQTPNLMRNTRMTKGTKSRFYDRFYNNRPLRFVHHTTEDDPYRATVVIGDKQFSGTGLTLQSAKHDAASKALIELQDEPSKDSQSTVSNDFEASGKVVHINGDVTSENAVDRSKSAISVVQEIAQKRDLPIRFVVESETGPAHMKHFVIKCSVGEMETTGNGNSKKVAKKHAAEIMLNELKKLPPLRSASEMQGSRRKNFAGKRIASANSRQQVQQTNARRKGSQQVKEVNNTSTSATETTTNDNERVNNAVQTLLHIQQTTQQPEPLFNVVEERGANRRKQFVVEISYAGLTARGTSSNKKLAKREAAKNMLIQLGYNEFDNSDVITSQNANSQNASRKVTFSEARVHSENIIGQSVGGAAGRQLVPGILLMKSPENNRKAKNSTQPGINYTTTATIAKELLDAGTSPTAEAIINQNSPIKKKPTEDTKSTIEISPSKIEPNNNNIEETKTNSSHGGIRATDQLLYLADLLKFEVQFDDFPRGNHKDYLTLASLNTDPPQMFHGSGSSLEVSKNNAALAALKALSELGLDNVNRPRDQQPKSILSNGKSN